MDPMQPEDETSRRPRKGRHQLTADEKFHEMTEAPVRPLIMSLAAPSIVSNLITSVYNLTDTFFVSGLGTAASGAIGISFVAMTAIQAVGFYFGQGTGSAISRYLGARNREKACVVATTGLACTLLFGLVIAVVGNLLIDPICLAAGSTTTILPYARTFVGIILMGAPFMCSTLMLNMQLRFEGEAAFAMVAVATGAVLNMGITPLLIYAVGLGIAGSAISTVICEGISLCLLVHQMQKAGITPLSPRWLRKPTLALAREINNGGVPSFVRQVMLGVATTLLNGAARPFGDAAIAGLAIVQRICGFGNYVQIGMGQGFQPIIGYNYGAHKYGRIREGYHEATRMALVAVWTIGVFTCAFAPQLIAFFNPDPEVVEVGTLTLRLESFTMALAGNAMITNFLLQTTGRMWRATLLGACRLGLVLGPVVLVLSSTFGLLGVQLAQPVTDLIVGLISVPLARQVLAELDRGERASR